MTTIAWDGKSLATDTLIVSGSMPRRGTKITLERDRSVIVAGAGNWSDLLRFREWVAKRWRSEVPPPAFDDQCGFTGFVVERGARPRLYIVHTNGAIEDNRAKYVAAGSGRDFALSALHFGLSALGAVKFAARFDVYTGGTFETYAGKI